MDTGRLPASCSVSKMELQYMVRGASEHWRDVWFGDAAGNVLV